ncbi:MAG: hypothetical protein BGO54_03310 [Sphingobacteriales bacterium 46-32]|nr:MAG: hypothetical protein BGO54_03310 [Sphingobacteriales bacterium 46-32]
MSVGDLYPHLILLNLYTFIRFLSLLTAREGYRGYTILALFFPLYKSPSAGVILLFQNNCTRVSTLFIQF